ncbi:hypothetical protein [Paraburkholderia lacunae]|uniref:Uncharacterized protein n=1 Tax=Paraburkholderia lacunae TaxID=2211104 RepID=A0A370N876_9BURK|nr:hypothetical protein [Paraburkholderia lacunae]RDK01823.1 hypothetical protein DLM46_15780 [Paraburkholderia lacunae]
MKVDWRFTWPFIGFAVIPAWKRIHAAIKKAAFEGGFLRRRSGLTLTNPFAQTIHMAIMLIKDMGVVQSESARSGPKRRSAKRVSAA